MKAIIIFLGNLIFINQNEIGFADNLSSFDASLDGAQSISARSESTDQMIETENKFSSRSSEDLRSLGDDDDERSIENDEDDHDDEESDESQSRVPKLKLPKAIRNERRRLLKKAIKKEKKIQKRLRSSQNGTDYHTLRNTSKINYQSIMKSMTQSSQFIKGKGWMDDPQAVRRYLEGSSWEKHAKQKNISKRAKSLRQNFKRDMKRTGTRKHEVQNQRVGRFRNVKGGRQRGYRPANAGRGRYKSMEDEEEKNGRDSKS